MDNILEIFDNPLANIITGFSIIIALIIPIKRAWINLKKSINSKHWDSTIGKIIKSQVTNYKDDEGVEMYKLDLKYSYFVKDKVYFSSSRFVDEEYGQTWIGSIQDFTKKNKPDDKIKVYFDPMNPDTSVIINKPRPIYFLILIGYMLGVLLAIGMTIDGIQNFK